MQFEEIFKLIIKEQERPKEELEPQPWCLEVKKDFAKSDAYNKLGDLIIKLFEIRAKL